jgi:hypothetical protein
MQIIRRIIFSAMLAVLISRAAATGNCKITEGTLGEFQTLVLENDLVRVTVMPQVGGRIVEYALKSSGHNQLFSDTEAFKAYKPGETMTRTVMYVAGGHEDTIRETGEWNWPNDFEQEPYAVEIVADSPEVAAIRLSAARGNVGIQRVHTLRRNSTTLTHDLTVTNISQEPIEMMLRHRVALQVGGEARRGDTIAYPAKSGIVRKNFFPDNVWTDFMLNDGWVSASDPVTRETFLMTSEFENLGNGGIWFDRKHFYNLEFFAKKGLVAAGATAHLTAQWHLLSDVPVITFANKDCLGYFEGTQGEANDFTLKTGVVALKESRKLDISGILYNGPNIIDDFQQQLAAEAFSSTTASLTKKLFSPVDQVHATFRLDDREEVKLTAPLIDTHPPEPIALKPLTNEKFRYCVQDSPQVQLWIESTAGVVLPDEIFTDSKPPDNCIEIELLPNEYECFQLAIRPKQGAIREIRPVFEDLKEVSSGATLPAGSFLFYRGGTITHENVSLYDPLVPGADVEAVEGKNAMLFVELHCDTLQLPGVYEGVITLQADRSVFEPISIRVRVRPFQMPHARSVDTAFWVWKTWNCPGHNNTDTWSQLSRYRLSPGWLRAGGTSQTAEFLDADGKAAASKLVDVWPDGVMDWYSEGLHEFNINRFSPGHGIWGYADSWDWKHALVRNKRAAAAWLDKRGLLDRCYYQIVDEPLASRFDHLKEVIKLYRQANPDYTVMCTVAINPDLYGYIDMWHVPWGALEQKVAQQRQALGERVWLYNAVPDISGVGKLPRLIGWFCWKYKLDGYMHFAIDYPDSPTVHNPWQSTGSHWTIFFYPTVKSYDEKKHIWENSAQWDWDVPSIRLMQIRDGFEDYEYMKLLEKWINLARRHSANERNETLISEAEALLDIEHHFLGDFISYTDTPEDIMEARKRIGDMIEELRHDVTGEPYQ